MTLGSIVVPFLIVAFFVVLIMFVLSRHPGFRGRSIEEVAHYMNQVREYLPELEANLDPKQQASLQAECGEAYRAEITRLVRCYKEFLGRMRRNVNVLYEFAETEAFDLKKACRAAYWSLTVAKAGHAHLSRLERMPETEDFEELDLEEDGNQVTAQQLADSEATINNESEHLATLRHRAHAAESFMRAANRCHTAFGLPLLRATLWNMMPFERLTFLPVPKLAKFGTSGDVYLPAKYCELKAAAVELIALLYPAAEEIRNEIEAQM